MWSIKYGAIWMTLNPDFFKGTPLFDVEYLRNVHDRDRVLIGTYTRPTQRCNFEWPWVTLSSLAKFPTIWTVAQPVRDSWASCVKKRSSAVAVTIRKQHACVYCVTYLSLSKVYVLYCDIFCPFLFICIYYFVFLNIFIHHHHGRKIIIKNENTISTT